MIARWGLGSQSHVVELASNDGYLLQYFVARQVPVLGIEPAANVAKVAEAKGVPTLVKFFGRDTARELVAAGKKADLIIGNNVLAQVPDINDFVSGMKMLLHDRGVITMEFPHLQQLMANNQYDTIYHEHFSYFSFLAVDRIFDTHGLVLFDVEELPTHGGSLRVYARHKEDTSKPVESRAKELLRRELELALRQARDLRQLRRAGQSHQAAFIGVLDRRQERRAIDRRIRGSRQGQHAAELLRDSN